MKQDAILHRMAARRALRARPVFLGLLLTLTASCASEPRFGPQRTRRELAALEAFCACRFDEAERRCAALLAEHPDGAMIWLWQDAVACGHPSTSALEMAHLLAEWRHVREIALDASRSVEDEELLEDIGVSWGRSRNYAGPFDPARVPDSLIRTWARSCRVGQCGRGP